MAQPLKELINPTSVGVLADGLAAAWAAFPRDRFVRTAGAGLDGLELKDRVRHVAGALGATLPASFPEAAAIVRESTTLARLDMWSGWPATEYVAVHGLGHLDEGMRTLATLTPYATGEFAVRPYLDLHRDDALRVMRGFADSADEHLRRLASEGSRPRLPWGARVRWLMEHGTTLPILDHLRDDPSEYVRRSVANHVNDITKDHPDLAVRTLARWRAEGGSHVEAVLRHAVRGLLRAGHAGALTLVGATPGQGSVRALTLSADQVAVGGHLRFTATVAAGAEGPLVLRYAVRREGSRRVFHLAERTATTPGQTFTLTKSHSFKPVTTRTEPPGPRLLEIMVNGTLRATAPFTLTS
ncbi:DNA alkylation repair protein [Sphaerisporangium aureirubrum]|uniref:DNA alkylation repair protein n=1 Tax=Sphaerisporangium aureirubrum TaxID=1544736 RepID=A0ABW1NF34_9ACTN